MFKINFNYFRNLLGLILGCSVLSISTVFAFKMGVIDGQTIRNAPAMDTSDRQKQIINEYYPTLLNLQKEYTNLESEFNKNEVLMDDATRKEKKDKLIKVAKSINALKQKFEMKVFQLEQETTQKISDISTRIAKKYGFDVVLTTPTTGGYVSKKVDMTKEALKMLK